MKLKSLFLLCCFWGATNLAQAQGVTIGSNQEPHADAILELISNDKKGMLLPRLELVDMSEPDPLSVHEAGMVVYNTGGALSPGYYFNNGAQWVLILDTDSAPWRNADTGDLATSNTDNMYQMGAIGINTPTIDPNAQLDVKSNTKGVLLPRMTTLERNAIPAELANGLLIYNTSTNCFNYYEGAAKKWVSLCGTYEPANFEFADCSGGPEPTTAGAYKAGVALNSSHTYTIKVRVSEPGTYQAVLSTSNGYSFSKSGTFTETGTYTLILEGQGTPSKASPAGGDVVTPHFNGKITLPTCTLPTITVDPSSASFTYEPCNGQSLGGTRVYGDYQKGKALDGSHYVEIQITGTSAGTTVIETNFVNGFKYSSGAVNIESGVSQTVKLYAQGNPAATGTFTYTPAGAPCGFTVSAGSSLGTFANPAASCLAIYNEDNTKTDGEYWVRIGSTSTAVKTLCDMTNGGYTLLWSYSEYTARNTYGSSGRMDIRGESNIRMQNNFERNNVKGIVTGAEPTANLNLNDHRLNKTTMTSVRTASTGKYRVHIAYDPRDVNDVWAAENRMIFSPTSRIDPITGSDSNEDSNSANRTNLENTSRIFGKVVYSTGAREKYNMNGMDGEMRFYSDASYGAHWDHTTNDGWRSVTWSHAFPKPDGTTVTYSYDPHDFNNIFGWHAETDINHHFGKCGQNSDDFAFSPADCSTSNRYPHSFNNGQGRYMQWWVK